MTDAEHSGGRALREHRTRELSPRCGRARIATGVHQQTEPVVVAPARAGRVDDEGPAAMSQHFGRLEQRRAGAFPARVGRRQQMSLALEAPWRLHARDVEPLRKAIVRLGPARPHEEQAATPLQRDAVDGPCVRCRLQRSHEVVRPARVVAGRAQDVHAVMRVVTVARGEVDVPARADPLQLGRPDLSAVRPARRRAEDDRSLGGADVLQAARARDHDRGVVDRSAVVVPTAMANHRRVRGSGRRRGIDDRVGEIRCACRFRRARERRDGESERSGRAWQAGHADEEEAAAPMAAVKAIAIANTSSSGQHLGQGPGAVRPRRASRRT